MSSVAFYATLIHVREPNNNEDIGCDLMKSVKPGRGPSMMGGVMSIAAGLFGIIWTVSAVSMGAPAPFALFGFVFIAIAIYQAIYHFRNATGAKRYSAFDIVDSAEEPDPLNDRFGNNTAAKAMVNTNAHCFWPYCGAEAKSDFAFCSQCGKKLPS